jgi:hypothetical protein
MICDCCKEEKPVIVYYELAHSGDRTGKSIKACSGCFWTKGYPRYWYFTIEEVTGNE